MTRGNIRPDYGERVELLGRRIEELKRRRMPPPAPGSLCGGCYCGAVVRGSTDPITLETNISFGAAGALIPLNGNSRSTCPDMIRLTGSGLELMTDAVYISVLQTIWVRNSGQPNLRSGAVSASSVGGVPLASFCGRAPSDTTSGTTAMIEQEARWWLGTTGDTITQVRVQASSAAGAGNFSAVVVLSVWMMGLLR